MSGSGTLKCRRCFSGCACRRTEQPSNIRSAARRCAATIAATRGALIPRSALQEIAVAADSSTGIFAAAASRDGAEDRTVECQPRHDHDIRVAWQRAHRRSIRHPRRKNCRHRSAVLMIRRRQDAVLVSVGQVDVPRRTPRQSRRPADRRMGVEAYQHREVRCHFVLRSRCSGTSRRHVLDAAGCVCRTVTR